MTDFDIKLRHRCRNPHCRSKLPTPVVNEREAFCCRGCYESFHLHRCRVCEGPIEQKRGAQRVICAKAKCRNAWKAKAGFGRFLASMAPDSVRGEHKARNVDSTRVESRVKDGRQSPGPAAEHWTGTWNVLRVIAAGAPVAAGAYHGAVVGAGEALAEDARLNEAHWRAAKAGKQGYRRSGSPALAVVPQPIAVDPDAMRRYAIPDDLSIPEFLRRYPPRSECERLAA